MAINPIQVLQAPNWNDTNNIRSPFAMALNSALNTWTNISKGQRESAKASLPFGGEMPSGAAGKIVGLEMLKKYYGENSPQYQAAKQQFDLDAQSDISRIHYQDKLANTVPIRYTTPEGRRIIESDYAHQGLSPTGTPVGEPVIPGAPNYMGNNVGGTSAANQYDLKTVKQNIPASVLSKNLYATNIEKTVDNLDLDKLTQFNGLLSQPELKKQEALDLIGKSSPEYQEYKAQVNLLNFLGSQVRQFYGDSIQPNAMEKKIASINPTGAFISSGTGKQKFNNAIKVLKQELQTYRDAGQSTDVYKGQPTKGSGASQLSKGITLPKFNSKEEYQAWFNKQPSITQHAIRLHLGEK